MHSVSYAKPPKFAYHKLDPKKLQYTNVPLWTPAPPPGEEEKEAETPAKPATEATSEESTAESSSGKDIFLLLFVNAYTAR